MITLTKAQRNALWEHGDPFLHEFQFETTVAALHDLGLVDDHGMPTEQGEALRQRLARAGWVMAIELHMRTPERYHVYAEKLSADDPVLTFENQRIENVPYLLSRARDRAAGLAEHYKDADNDTCQRHVNNIGDQCRAVLAALQRLRDRAAGFDVWYQAKIEEMLGDELLRYMYGRFGDKSQIENVGPEGITVSYENSDEVKFTYFYPTPPEAIDHFYHDDQHGSGFLIERHGAVVKKYVHVADTKHELSPPGAYRKYIDHIYRLAEEACQAFDLG